MTLGTLSKAILVGVTVEAENKPMANIVSWFSRRLNTLLSKMYLLTKLENHIRKKQQTLAAINVDSDQTFKR